MIPRGTAIRTDKTVDERVSISVGPNFSSTCPNTGRLFRYEIPRLPCSMAASQRKYCIIAGSFNPICVFKASMLSLVAMGSAMSISKGLPGAIAEIR